MAPLTAFDNPLAAWCIVPYDSEGRGPAGRASMLARLGLAGEVWDWRDDNVAEFEEELDALASRKVSMMGLWAPTAVPETGHVGVIHPSVRGFVAECANRGLTPDLWACAEFGRPGAVDVLDVTHQIERVQRFADHLEPLAELAADNGMRVGLYNHLGWFGEPENQIEIVDALGDRGHTNVGLVYQQHHGHHHMDRWPALLETMKPHLFALGLNGMIDGAHWGGRKIHPLGHGPRDVELIRAVVDSGWTGLVTVLCHTMDDAEARLRDNLEGLAWIEARLHGEDGDLPAARIPRPVWPH